MSLEFDLFLSGSSWKYSSEYVLLDSPDALNEDLKRELLPNIAERQYIRRIQCSLSYFLKVITGVLAFHSFCVFAPKKYSIEQNKKEGVLEHNIDKNLDIPCMLLFR